MKTARASDGASMSRAWVRASTLWTPARLLQPLQPLLSAEVEELSREDARRLLEGLTYLNWIRVIPFALPGLLLGALLPNGGGLSHTVLATAGLIEVIWLPCLMLVLGIARARMPREVRPLMVPGLSRWCLTYAVEIASVLAVVLGLATSPFW
jgi:hypothetical protein